MNNISVIVRNRLGATYGTRQIDVNEDDGEGRYPVAPGDEEELPQNGGLQSIGIEALDPQDGGFRGNGTPIPITIDSPQNYVISTLHHEAENRWRIEFEAQQRSLKSIEKADPEPPPVNITIGHDDPGWGLENRMSINKALCLGGITSAASVGLSQISTLYGFGIPIALVIGGVVFWYKQWKENKKKT